MNQYKIIKTKDQYEAFIADLMACKDIIGLDTETEKFDKKAGKDLPRDLALEGIGAYCPTASGYILANIVDDKFQQVLDNKVVALHNAKFDLEIFLNSGFSIDKIDYHDTLMMSWLCNENRRTHALKDLAGSVLNVKEKQITRFKDLEDKPALEDFKTEDEHAKAVEEWQEAMGLYCINDCKYTYNLFHIFKPKMKKAEVWSVYNKLEIPFVRVLFDMEHRGIGVDIDYLKKLGKTLDEKLTETATEIYKIVGRDINISSPKQLKEYFYIEQKIDLPEEFRTPKGDLSTAVNALTYLRDKLNVKVAGLILQYREFAKLNSTYVKGLLDRQRQGIVYASFRQTGAVTGRLSSSNPNLQNIPRRDDALNIRHAFKARDGYKFIISDYSQLELRLMAWYAKEDNMIDIYDNDGDIHQSTADAIGCDRFTAKSINFGLNYGRTAYGLAFGLKIPVEEAEKFIQSYFDHYPNVAVFMQQAKNTVRKKYAVRTILNRKRRFPEYASAVKRRDRQTIGRIERQAGNSIIQGSASDVMKVAMRNMARRFKDENMDAHLLIQIHDEVLVEAKEEVADKVMAIVKHEMEHAVNLKIIKLVTEPKIADTWVK